jgi:hypothetical protein
VITTITKQHAASKNNRKEQVMDPKKKRGKNITQAMFDTCIEEMVSNQIVPTVTAITSQIGGSYTTISKYLDTWRQTQSTQSGTVLSVPLFVKEAAEKIGLTWWALVEHDVAERIDKANQEAQARIDLSSHERNEFLASTDYYRQLCEDAEHECERLVQAHQNDISTHHLELSALKTELAVVTQQMSYQDKTITQHETTIQKLTNEITHRSEAVKDHVVRYDDLMSRSQQEIADIKAEHQAQFSQLKKATEDSKLSSQKVEDSLRALLAEKERQLQKSNGE